MRDTDHSNWVTLARVLRPHGRRGEAAAEILTDFPERLLKLKYVFLWDGRSERRKAAVRRCWLSHSRGGQAIFHFEGSDSISAAETLRGAEIQVPMDERVPLSAGQYYVTDLIGCEVRTREGEALGRVSDVQVHGENMAGTPVLAVQSARGEWLLPLAEEICVAIDIQRRQIQIVPPDGLLDLNRGS